MVTASFPLQACTFDTVTFLPCEPDAECPTGARFAVMGPDRALLAAFDHPWITMKPGNGAAAPMPGSFIYGGVLVSHFGHVLRDGLAGLWFIRQRPELPILWHWLDLPVPHSAWPTWLDEIWQILGLDRHAHHIIKAPVTVDQVILPDPGLMAPNVLHRMQARALARLLPAAAVSGDRVWLSRSHLPDQFGCFVREDEVAAILAAQGWRIFHPQEHSVAGQVDVFATAAIVAGPVGSAFHAVLLSAAPRAKLILVQRPGIERTFHDAVARALDLDQYCIEPDLQPFSESHPWARFTLADPSGLANRICRLAAVLNATESRSE
jgi:capsular polysaccharide biosynthesis protein